MLLKQANVRVDAEVHEPHHAALPLRQTNALAAVIAPIPVAAAVVAAALAAAAAAAAVRGREDGAVQRGERLSRKKRFARHKSRGPARRRHAQQVEHCRRARAAVPRARAARGGGDGGEGGVRKKPVAVATGGGACNAAVRSRCMRMHVSFLAFFLALLAVQVAVVERLEQAVRSGGSGSGGRSVG